MAVSYGPSAASDRDFKVFAVIAGGGTAGHVLPALAVAEGLVAAGHLPDAIHYMGAVRGIEARMLPQTPFRHSLYDVVGLQRRLSMSNFGFLPRLVRARGTARRFLADHQVRVVVSVGGYASLPAVLAARSLQIPVVVVSYDRWPGRASRLAARRAAACAVSFSDSVLPRAVVTGAPIRQSILGLRRARDRDAARAALGVEQHRFMVAVVGGSHGSGVLNREIAQFLEASRSDRGLAIHHVVGDRFLSDASPASDGSDGVAYTPVGFEDRMDLVFAACDLLIARGGASTVHEVAVTGTPAILVPWSGAVENHQHLNVRWLSDQGGAVMLEEGELAFLADLVHDLRMSTTRRVEIGSVAFEMGEVHRRGALTALIESVALA